MDALVKDSTGGAMEALDTFDNAQAVNPQAFDTPQEEEINPQTKEINQTDQLEEATDEGVQGQGQEEGPEESDDKGEEESEEGQREEAETTREERTNRRGGSKVKGRIGDKQVEFDEDAEVRVKVDGKFMNVPLSEMRDAYSSITKNNELGEEIQEREGVLQEEMDAYTEERGELLDHLGNISDLLDDPDGNPMDAVYYLLDMTGRNRNDYYKSILSHHLEEVENLQLMSDTERKGYFLEKENEYLREQQANVGKVERESEETEAFMNDLTAQREALGVSEDEFVNAYNDLLELGTDPGDMNSDEVLEYAAYYPVVEEAERIVEAFDPELVEDDEVVRAIAETIIEDPKITQQEIRNVLAESFGEPSSSRRVNKKANAVEGYYETSRPSGKVGRNKEDSIESFDDFDHYGKTHRG